MGIWSLLFVLVHDFKVPTWKPSKYSRVVAIFPHPDDESMSVAGLLHLLASCGVKTTLAFLTKGERGTEGAKLDMNLKSVRSKEAQTSGCIIGADIVQADLGDGMLKKKTEEVERFVVEVIEDTKPDLVITFDESGLYGHEDHIATAEAVTKYLRGSAFPADLWYVVLPEKMMKNVKLPEHMAKDTGFKEKRMVPTHKVWIGRSIVPKIRSLYAHKSQRRSFKKSYPIAFLPRAFYAATGLFEYFHEVRFDSSGKVSDS